MPTHDPKREIEKLREHLASPDKPIAFLMGAGTSCSVRVDGQPLVPAVAAMTEFCKSAVDTLGTLHETAFAAVRDELLASGLLSHEPNIEDVLSSVRHKLDAMGESDTLAGADRATMASIEDTIQRTIASLANPAEERIPQDLPHRAFARWIGRIDRVTPVEIFTTNYDTLLERALEAERVPVFDGFVGSHQPFFLPASLERLEFGPGRRWARLWKIHGSVNWQRRPLAEGSFRITRGSTQATGEMILPSSHKYDESRKQPYVAMLDRLGHFLSQKGDPLLVVVGYSFGDQHINDVLFEALDVQDRLHVIALQFENPAAGDLLATAAKRRNLLVYGPSTAMVSGVLGNWRLADPVDERTSELLDGPFDSDAEVREGANPVTGRFRLGDFAWLARFLDDMAGHYA